MFDHVDMARSLGHARELIPLEVLAERVRPVTLARDQQLPVLPALAPLLPGGALRRGATVAVGAASGLGAGAGAAGATSLALALAAGPSQAGAWVAAVGLGSLGAVAAAGFGVALDRLALVDDPAGAARPGTLGGRGGRGTVSWAAVVAGLVDGFDVVLVAAGPGWRRRPADARRLVARVRERGAVLVAVGGDLPERSQVRLSVAAAAWEPIGGMGHLHGRRVTVEAGGRGEASRPRRAELWLPSPEGRVVPVEPLAPAVPLPRPAPAGPPPPRRPAPAEGSSSPPAVPVARPAAAEGSSSPPAVPVAGPAAAEESSSPPAVPLPRPAPAPPPPGPPLPRRPVPAERSSSPPAVPVARPAPVPAPAPPPPGSPSVRRPVAAGPGRRSHGPGGPPGSRVEPVPRRGPGRWRPGGDPDVDLVGTAG
jgi:pyruvate/2-oxoglutarate dehydrogenase complex dihydrolipoamide acyltransferase (E2) component